MWMREFRGQVMAGYPDAPAPVLPTFRLKNLSHFALLAFFEGCSFMRFIFASIRFKLFRKCCKELDRERKSAVEERGICRCKIC